MAMTDEEQKAFIESVDRDYTALQEHYEAAISMSVEKDAQIEALTKRVDAAEAHALEATNINATLHRSLSELPALQAFLLEVTKFHREALLPLVDITQKMIATAQVTPGSEQAQVLASIKGFLQTIENRTKHYEQNKLVVEARKRAEAELMRLTVKEVPPMIAAGTPK